jgi:hypothetical protein
VKREHEGALLDAEFSGGLTHSMVCCVSPYIGDPDIFWAIFRSAYTVPSPLASVAVLLRSTLDLEPPPWTDSLSSFLLLCLVAPLCLAHTEAVILLHLVASHCLNTAS